MATLTSPAVEFEPSPPPGWASISPSSPQYNFGELIPEPQRSSSNDTHDFEAGQQRSTESSAELSSCSNGFTPSASTQSATASAYPTPPTWRDPLAALEGRSTPFNPVWSTTPPPTAGRLNGGLGPSALWQSETGDEDDQQTPPHALPNRSLWEQSEQDKIAYHGRTQSNTNGDGFGRYPSLPTPPPRGARISEIEKLYKIVHLLSERVQQLESTQAAHEAELSRQRSARLSQQRQSHTPQQSNETPLSQMQVRQLQSQLSMTGSNSVSPLSPLSGRQGTISLLGSTNSNGASRSLTPLQQPQPPSFNPLKQIGAPPRPVTPPRLPLMNGPTAGYTFGVGVPPSPTEPHSVGQSPSYANNFSASPLAGRSTSLVDFNSSPLPSTPFYEHGLSLASTGERFDSNDGFDWTNGGQIGGGGGLFGNGFMSASPMTTNPRRGRTRAQSEGVPSLAQAQRPRGASFSQIAPIVAQAKWMASNQTQQPVYAPTGMSMMGSFGGGPMPHAPAEHINYRALVEHDLEIDAESFVRRILTHNDQQCSMYLQQRLKTTTQEHRKTAIIDAVQRMLYDLCLSKFGNFLVSRCLEQGGLALAIEWSKQLKGNLLQLSLDPFGCHCVQKLLDCGDKTTKNLVVDEIIDHAETLTQKNSGHVWSKLLAGQNVPAFYERLSATGAGSWAQIAKEETGSLVVQSILENWEGAYSSSIASDCEKDIQALATSQWGSFVLLHLIEQASPAFRNRAVEPSAALSLDHFGAKAVEKAFKSGQICSAAVTAYVDAICKPVEGCGRPAVIDIASHQSGSQLLTLLFTGQLTTFDDKTKLIHAVRSYGVTLKQNKHGQKIYFLCERARTWAGH